MRRSAGGDGPWQPDLGLSLPQLHPGAGRGRASGDRPRPSRLRAFGKAGRSGAVSGPSARGRLDALLESLELRGATVVPQDWGGPIGLYWATHHPERVAGLFILNTYAHGCKPEALPPGKNEIPLPLPLRLFRTPVVGEVLVKGLDAFKRGFLFGQGSASRAPHADRQARLPGRASGLVRANPDPGLPARDPGQRRGAGGRDDHRDRGAAEAGLSLEASSDRLGHEGPGFPASYLDTLWLDTFPDAAVTRLEDAGHYLQEDAHEQIVPQLVSFVSELHAPGAARVARKP